MPGFHGPAYSLRCHTSDQEHSGPSLNSARAFLLPSLPLSLPLAAIYSCEPMAFAPFIWLLFLSLRGSRDLILDKAKFGLLSFLPARNSAMLSRA